VTRDVRTYCTLPCTCVWPQSDAAGRCASSSGHNP